MCQSPFAAAAQCNVNSYHMNFSTGPVQLFNELPNPYKFGDKKKPETHIELHCFALLMPSQL